MINLESGVASRITLDVLGVDGAIRNSLQFCNVMTNYGLDSWAKGILGNHIALGSGSRTELPTATDLAAFVRTASGTYDYTNTNVIDEVNGVMRSDLMLNIVFPIETSAQNYSELGIHDNNRLALQTYARIRDAAGEPTSIGVQVGEQVRVSYVVQYSMPLTRTTNQTIGTNSTTVTAVALRTGSTNGVRLPSPSVRFDSLFWAAGQGIPDAGVLPTGGVEPPQLPYISSGEYLFSAKLDQLNLTGGISLIRMGGVGNGLGIMCHFNPPIDKNDGVGLSIKVTAKLTNGVFYA